jgi:hypothetical protein
MKRFRRIMHASDFSPASRPAFRKAIELAKSTGARLLVVHARSPVIPPLMGEGEQERREYMPRRSSSKAYPRTGSSGPRGPSAPIFWCLTPTAGRASPDWFSAVSQRASLRPRAAPY